jgi:transcriptional regulator with PAS, ATPase and Fis domain
MDISDDRILDILVKSAPYLRKLIEGEIDITVTSLDKWLAYCPCGEEKLNIKVGDQVQVESVSGKCMKENRLVVKRMGGELFGHRYVGRAVPVHNTKGEVIGSIGYLKIIDRQEEIENMVIGRNKKMQLVYRQALKAASVETNVMLIGETGTGKDLLAQLIHEKSSRKSGPFVVVNCTAIPESLFESEMFGYESGAFTGAARVGKMGFFEMAHMGTIYLDEIGDLGLNLQAKLLRVLQSKKITRLGGKKEIEANVRVIASTNRNLEQMVFENSFRSDLYFRLSSLSITIPSLWDRKEDLPLLIDWMLAKKVKEFGKGIRTISPSAYKMLLEYEYPGNVRELENIIQRGVIMTDGDTIDEADLENAFRNLTSRTALSQDPEQVSPSTLEEAERRLIARSLRFFSYKKEVAHALGISRDTLYRKMKKYGFFYKRNSLNF